jgi:hypothetical protein
MLGGKQGIIFRERGNGAWSQKSVHLPDHSCPSLYTISLTLVRWFFNSSRRVLLQMGRRSVESFTTSHTLITPIVSAVNRTRWGEVPVTSRYAASDSTGLLCAEIEPTGGSPPGELGEDRSLENVVITHSHSQNKRERREIRKSTDQKRTDLSELLDTSSPRDGTTRSVLTKSSCASVDEIIALVLEESQKLSLDQQQARGGTAHIRVPNLDGLHLEASRR